MNFTDYKRAVQWGIRKGLIRTSKWTVPTRIVKQPKGKTTEKTQN